MTSGRRPTEQSPRSTGRDRPNSRGDATRLRILMTAEQLFAERGISAVALRDIGVAAGQKNNVAVQYHFQDRENLLREITAYRAQASEHMRAELLAELMAGGRPPRVYDLVKAFVRSFACHLERDNYYLAFLSRYVIERGGYVGFEGLSVGGTTFTFTAMLRRLLPDYPDDIIQERWVVMMTSAVHTLARYQSAMQAGSLPGPLPDLIEDLVRFLTAGLEAPPNGVHPA
ncbi:TetR/AcrR family transcriptional regulator [Frankia sp. AgB1.9]|nr:TetR/AcrR family transcriptional regulator [Frankia sp. AgW1.1]MBL7553220.1 TetR/AcrR family transcriptional regulator [Frankia sp. AgB1.9]MBL7620169.1 TetR/AcrR family transcriptional regulator [Frankia sp. AgB1.8]